MMMNKKLMKEVPESMKYVKKAVFVKWIALLANVIAVLSLASGIDALAYQTYTSQHLIGIGIVFIIAIIVRIVCAKKQALYAYEASSQIKIVLREKILNKLFRMKQTYLNHVSTAEVVHLASEGVEQLETYFAGYLPQFFYSMLAPITLFILLSWIDVKSAFVLLICVPLIPLSIVAVQKIAKRILAKYWSSYTTLSDSFLENLQGLTTLKIYQCDEQKNEEMKKEAEHFRKITMKVLIMQLNSISIMDLVAYGGAALGCCIAVLQLNAGVITFGGALAIILLSSEFFIPLRLLGSFFHIAMNGMAASDKIYRLLELEEKQETKTLQEKIQQIKIDNISFSYDQTKTVLEDVTMKFQASHFYAIVGESGSGKSTIAKLLNKQIQGYTGAITFNQEEIADVKTEDILKKVGYLPFQSFLFEGTVRENLNMAKPNASEEELLQVLKKVRLYDFVMSQGGLDMEIKEGAGNLSGGQRQRLALARAFLFDCEIYIFDEATSNIDVESEELILQLIQQLAKEKTVIMITHRLENVKKCDHIYVMKQGKVVEEGTHKQLLQNQQEYATMYEQQRSLEKIRGE